MITSIIIDITLTLADAMEVLGRYRHLRGDVLDTAGETSLVWELTEFASQYLSRKARTGLYLKIGAGDVSAAIEDLLACVAHENRLLPQALATRVSAWIGGYAGSDAEPVLRSLTERIRVVP
jgi:hypothetical protein